MGTTRVGMIRALAVLGFNVTLRGETARQQVEALHPRSQTMQSAADWRINSGGNSGATLWMPRT